MKNLYTKEQVEWLGAFAPNHYIKDIIDCFNAQFNTDFNYDKIRYYLRKYKIKTLVHEEFTKKYSHEEINWIKNNYNNDLHQMVKDFNRLFNHNLSYKTFINLCNRHNIKSYSLHKYSKEEDEWIIKNYNNYIQNNTFRTKLFINDFEKEFGFKINNKYLIKLFKRLGIEKPKPNTGLERCPIGFEKKTNYGTLVKVSNNIPSKEYRWTNGVLKQTFNYRKKSHILYEQYYNVKINDETHLVIHLDEDNENFNKDNLYLISRKAFYVYHNTRYNNQTLETKLNALKVSEILQKIKEME